MALVSLATWLTPAPAHARGLVLLYGPDWLAEANARYRGYTLEPYWRECGLSVISPADLGKIVWVRVPFGQWFGPCLGVDTAARGDFYHIVYENREVAEVTQTLQKLMGFQFGMQAEIFIGPCPPQWSHAAHSYIPPLSFSNERRLIFKQWPAQQLPVDCSRTIHYDAANSRRH